MFDFSILCSISIIFKGFSQQRKKKNLRTDLQGVLYPNILPAMLVLHLLVRVIAVLSS